MDSEKENGGPTASPPQVGEPCPLSSGQPKTLVLATMLLLILAWRFVHAQRTCLDVGLSDEARYLYWGATLEGHGFPDTSFGPLYILWYHMLSLLQPDRLELYYLNVQILTLILPIAFLMLLVRLGCALIPSFILAYFLLISYANLPIEPKVNHFALIFLLLSLTVASHCPGGVSKLAALSGGTLLAAYSRPEFYSAFFVLLAILIPCCFRRKRSWRWIDLAAVVGLVLLLVFLIWGWGQPTGDGTRAWRAFGQHFAINWGNWAGEDLSNPWAYWKDIVRQRFGETDRISAALLANPTDFLRHVGTNLVLLPMRITGLFLMHPCLVLPGSWHRAEAVLLGVFLLFASIRALLDSRPFLAERTRQRWETIAASTVYIVIPLGTALIIYPRYHYLVPPLVIGQVVFAPLVFQRRSMGMTKPLAISVGWLVLLLLTPSCSTMPGFGHGQPHLATIRTLQSLGIKKEVKMLEGEEGFAFYLPENFHWVTEGKGLEAFEGFRKRLGVNLVVVTDKLLNHGRFQSDDEWSRFLRSPEKSGFTRIDVPATSRFLLVANDLLVPS